MRRTTLLALVATAIVVVALGWADGVLAQGCAMCKTTLDGTSDPLVEALNVSVLFMMSMPYLIVGTIGSWIYFASRRGHDAAPPPESREPKSLT